MKPSSQGRYMVLRQTHGVFTPADTECLSCDLFLIGLLIDMHGMKCDATGTNGELLMWRLKE